MIAHHLRQMICARLGLQTRSAHVRGCSGEYAWYLEGAGHALEQWVVVGVLHLAHHPMRHTRRPHHLQRRAVLACEGTEQNRKGVVPSTGQEELPMVPRRRTRGQGLGGPGKRRGRATRPHAAAAHTRRNLHPTNRSRVVHFNHLIFAQDQAAHLHCWTARQDRG